MLLAISGLLRDVEHCVHQAMLVLYIVDDVAYRIKPTTTIFALNGDSEKQPARNPRSQYLMRGLGSFLVVAGIISLGMQAVNSNFALFDWMDRWGGGAGMLLRAALIAAGIAIIAHSFYTGRHD